MMYKIYSGIADFPERVPIAYALTAGVKVIGIPEAVRPMKRCYPCRGSGRQDGRRCSACGGRGEVKMKGGVWANDRLFIKEFRSDRPAGTPWHKGVRPLAQGYEDFNGVSDTAPPTGSKQLIAFLPGGELREGLDGSVWNHHRRAPKLGIYKGLDLVQNQIRLDNPEPNHQAECVGDGIDATRWMPHPKTGQWGHHDIECLGEKCSFAECCNPYSRIWLMAPGTGQKNVGLMQFESNGQETASGMVGFFRRLREEAAEAGVRSLLNFPVRVTIGTRTASKGPNRYGRMLQNRRWPVVDFTPCMSLLEFASHQRTMLGGRPERIALPAPPATPAEMADSDQDLTLVDEVATRPTEDASVVDAEIVGEPSEAVATATPSSATPPPAGEAAGPFSAGEEGAPTYYRTTEDCDHPLNMLELAEDPDGQRRTCTACGEVLEGQGEEVTPPDGAESEAFDPYDYLKQEIQNRGFWDKKMLVVIPMRKAGILKAHEGWSDVPPATTKAELDAVLEKLTEVADD